MQILRLCALKPLILHFLQHPAMGERKRGLLSLGPFILWSSRIFHATPGWSNRLVISLEVRISIKQLPKSYNTINLECLCIKKTPHPALLATWPCIFSSLQRGLVDWHCACNELEVCSPFWSRRCINRNARRVKQGHGMINHQSPITNQQSAISNHQSPIINHQSSIINQQASFIIHHQ